MSMIEFKGRAIMAHDEYQGRSIHEVSIQNKTKFSTLELSGVNLNQMLMLSFENSRRSSAYKPITPAS